MRDDSVEPEFRQDSERFPSRAERSEKDNDLVRHACSHAQL